MLLFLPANTTSTMKPINKGVFLTFKSYYLGNIFCKVIPAIDSDYFGRSGQSKLKIFRKVFIILNVMM